MLSRVEKFHHKKKINKNENEEKKLSDTDRQLLKEIYEADVKNNSRIQKKFNVNKFLNYGIVITTILLIIVLYIAFSK